MESYFSGKWSDSSFDSYKWSGYRLVEEVNSHKPRSVLDVGCGFNRFKGKINNLLGIDPYNDCLLYTSPSPRDRTRSRMPSSA